jgi:hypothetical protein
LWRTLRENRSERRGTALTSLAAARPDLFTNIHLLCGSTMAYYAASRAQASLDTRKAESFVFLYADLGMHRSFHIAANEDRSATWTTGTSG